MMNEVADGCTVQERLTQVEGHLMGGSGSPGAAGSKGKKGLLEKKADDVSCTSCLWAMRRRLLDQLNVLPPKTHYCH